MRAEHLRTTGGPAVAKVLLTDEWVAQRARLSLAMNQPHVHAAVLVSSIFLLRVQSEAMGLEVGLKCDAQVFRAGRATSLAAAGSPTGVILAAGEWKSSAFLRYCQANDISVSAVLVVVCAEDED